MRRRKVPLEKCPDLKCRRARACMHPSPETHCRKLFVTFEERRWEIIAKMEEISAQMKRDGVKPEPMNITFEDDDDRKACTYYIILPGCRGALRQRGQVGWPAYTYRTAIGLRIYTVKRRT